MVTSSRLTSILRRHSYSEDRTWFIWCSFSCKDAVQVKHGQKMYHYYWLQRITHPLFTAKSFLQNWVPTMTFRKFFQGFINLQEVKNICNIIYNWLSPVVECSYVMVRGPTLWNGSYLALDLWEDSCSVHPSRLWEVQGLTDDLQLFIYRTFLVVFLWRLSAADDLSRLKLRAEEYCKHTHIKNLLFHLICLQLQSKNDIS